MGRFAQISRILGREGVRGVLNRARHTPLRSLLPQPAPPGFGGGVRLVDHGYPDFTARLGRILDRHGVRAEDGGQAAAWHVGIPPAGGENGVIVMPPDLDGGATVPWPVLRRAALVLDHDPGRLAVLSRARTGHPHYLALPEPAASDAVLSRAVERVLIFAGARPATDRDYRPDLPGDALPRLCLGLPEHPDRLASFRRDGLPGFRMVQGLRRQPGWMGAASSYRQIARALLDTGRRAAIICQDDAGPGPDFDRRFAASLAYWQESGADLFSGLVTDVDDGFRITRVVRRDGMTFVHLNCSIGLVCTMFGSRALDRLAAWDERGQTVAGGTIDRYLGATPGLDVVTCLPFLVRHRGGLSSSIWGFRNNRYDTLIGYSERRLARMVAEFERAGAR